MSELRYRNLAVSGAETVSSFSGRTNLSEPQSTTQLSEAQKKYLGDIDELLTELQGCAVRREPYNSQCVKVTLRAIDWNLSRAFDYVKTGFKIDESTQEKSNNVLPLVSAMCGELRRFLSKSGKYTFPFNDSYTVDTLHGG